jgi:hypothetical protein
MAASSEELDKFQQLFRFPLLRPCTKLPRLTRREWTSSKLDKTALLFKDHGFQAWLAYFWACHRCEGSKKYQGRSADKRTLLAFQNLSEEDKKKVATALVKLEVHETVRNAMNAFHASDRKKRLCSVSSSSYACPNIFIRYAATKCSLTSQ